MKMLCISLATGISNADILDCYVSAVPIIQLKELVPDRVRRAQYQAWCRNAYGKPISSALAEQTDGTAVSVPNEVGTSSSQPTPNGELCKSDVVTL